MHEEYNIMDLKPRKNPYVKTCKKQVTINLDENVITYFKNLSKTGVIKILLAINDYVQYTIYWETWKARLPNFLFRGMMIKKKSKD